MKVYIWRKVSIEIRVEIKFHASGDPSTGLARYSNGYIKSSCWMVQISETIWIPEQFSSIQKVCLHSCHLNSEHKGSNFKPLLTNKTKNAQITHNMDPSGSCTAPTKKVYLWADAKTTCNYFIGPSFISVVFLSQEIELPNTDILSWAWK